MKPIHPEVQEEIKKVRHAIRTSNPMFALEHANNACRLATQYKDSFGYDMARLCVAVSYTAMVQPSVAIPIYSEVWESIERDAEDASVFWMYTCYINALQGIGDWEMCIRYSYKAIELATEKKSQRALAQLRYALGLMFEKLGQYSQCMTNMDIVISIARTVKNEVEFLPRALLSYAALLVSTLNKKQEAIGYFQEALNIAHANNDHYLQTVALQNLASIHPQQQSIEVRDLYEKALEEARGTQILYPISHALRNLGIWHLENNNHKEAEKLFKEILRIAKKNPNEAQNFWTGHYTLASLYLASEQYDYCRKHLLSALDYLKEKSYDNDKRSTYDAWYQLEKATGNGNAALEWLEKLHVVERRIATRNQEEAAKATLIATRVDALLKELEEERQRTDRLQKTMAQQSSELIATSLELEEKKRALKKIKKIAKTTLENQDALLNASPSAPATEELEGILRDIGNDDHSWERFKDNLEHLHPEFIRRLLERCPDLSPMQIRICSLLRLQLASKEIADILKLSKRTVDNHREHIRVKLNIPRSVNLVAYILNI